MFKLYRVKNHDILFVIPLKDNVCKTYVFNEKFYPIAKFKCTNDLYDKYIVNFANITHINREKVYFMMESILNEEFKNLNEKYFIGDLGLG